MTRQGIGFGLFGGYLALLSAALMDGLARPQGQVFFAYAGDSPFTGDALFDARNRILLIGAIGAVVGVVAGLILWAARIRVAGGHGVVRTVLAGLLGITIGLVPTFLALSNTVEYPYEMSALWLYGANGIFAYALTLVVVYLTLRRFGDLRAESTTRTAAFALPIGAVLATADGVYAAWILGFSTAFSTYVVVLCVVLGILAATFALARAWATRRRSELA